MAVLRAWEQAQERGGGDDGGGGARHGDAMGRVPRPDDA